MTSLNVSLPEPQRAWVDRLVEQGQYGNASEYVRDLIRQDQKRRAEEHLDALLAEGLKSGDAGPMTVDFWEDLRRDARARWTEKTQDRVDKTGT